MTKPNILLVMTDQQRHDATSLTGPSFLRTPHLDILAAEGTVFTSAYSDCPICVPARVTMMTGRPAWDHGMVKNGRTTDVMGAEDTLPAELSALGYQTLAVGKMHFGPQRARHGFDEMVLPDDYYHEIRGSGSPLQPMRHGLGQLELYPGRSTVPEAMTLTAWTADRCVDFIRYRRDPTAPFFLCCSFSKPHPPLDPPEPYYSMYMDADLEPPIQSEWSRPEHAPGVFRRIARRRRIAGIDPVTMRQARAAYYGMVTHIDYSIGRLFGALQDAGEWDNTLILFVSDHGEFLGDHGNGGKLFFHEPSAHIPFVLRPPLEGGAITVPERITTPVCLADVFPTLVAAAGGSPRESEQSVNVLGEAFAVSGDRTIVGTVGYETECDYLAATDGRWKLIHYPEGPRRQLFDLASDPQETNDLLAVEHQGVEAANAVSRLENTIIQRLSEKSPKFLADGALPARESVADPPGRVRSHYSFHTEHFDGDVRH